MRINLKSINDKLIIQPKCESVFQPRLRPDSQSAIIKAPRILSSIKNLPLLHLNLIYLNFVLNIESSNSFS